MSKSKLPLERYLTHEFSLEQAASAYQMLDDRTEPFLRYVFRYEGS